MLTRWTHRAGLSIGPSLTAAEAQLRALGFDGDQAEAARWAQASGESRRRIEKVIGRYASSTAGAPGALWSETRLVANNNTRYIALMPGRSA